MNKWFILLLLGIFSCTTKEEKITYALPFPVIIDTLGVKKELLYGETKFPEYISTAHYPPYYIGMFKDSIYVCGPIGIFPPPPEPEEKVHWIPTCEYSYSSFYKYWESDNLSNYKYPLEDTVNLVIYVDTSKIFLDSYSTIVKNVDKDTVLVGHNLSISLVMEALDGEKKWKPIQEDFMFMCGNGVHSLILPPDNIILTVTPRFKGLYYTKLRLKLGQNYSNEFNGWINPGQFKSRY